MDWLKIAGALGVGFVGGLWLGAGAAPDVDTLERNNFARGYTFAQAQRYGLWGDFLDMDEVRRAAAIPGADGHGGRELLAHLAKRGRA